MRHPDRIDEDVWNRQRLLLVLGALAVTVVALLSGLAYTVYSGVAQATTAPTGDRGTGAVSGVPAGAGPDGGTTTADRGDATPAEVTDGAIEVDGALTRDAVAAAPMLAVGPQDARRGTPAATPAPTLEVPSPSEVGPADVPSGFPQTPAGAVAQLAEVTTTVLQAMSIPMVNDVHDEWVAPGGVGVEEWVLTRNVQAFLGTAGMGQSKDLSAAVVTLPVAGQVKGYDTGPHGVDWVVACVLFDVRATIVGDARMGWGHCERMVWDTTSDRWQIAPGQAPAQAPSTWPGTELSIAAGWRTWIETNP